MVYFTSEGMCSDNEALLLISLNHLSPTSAPVCNIMITSASKKILRIK